MMNQNARRVIRVTPTITGVTYANNDILFDTTEIPVTLLPVDNEKDVRVVWEISICPNVKVWGDTVIDIFDY